MLKTITLAALMAVTESVKLEQCYNTCACDNQDHLDNEVKEDKAPIIGEIDNIIEVILNGDEDPAIVGQLPTMVQALPKLEAAASPDQAADEQAANEKFAAEKAAAEAAVAAAAEKAAADAAAKKATEEEAAAKKA